MQKHDIPVGVLDESHVADAAVLDPDDLASGYTNLLHCGVDIRDSQCDPVLVRHELLTLFLRQPEREGDIRRLDLRGGALASREAENLRVPRQCASCIARRYGDEIDEFDSHVPPYVS